jgi:hypothetical protein
MEFPSSSAKDAYLNDNPSFKDFLEDQKLNAEFDEVASGNFDFTGYPEPLKKFRLILCEHDESIEGVYYWMHTNYHQDFGYTQFDKVIDVFAASEQSAFFGVSQQRLGLQQDKVSQFLAAIGKMVKELFQFVRELRIIDERLEIYKDSYSSDKKQADSADITLKGIWIDMVEGGAKNPASVYGLAREVGFTILPDLFFAVRVKPKKVDVDFDNLSESDLKKLFNGEVENLDDTVEQIKSYNRKVREVLKRKLRTFHTWKKHTFNELHTRRRFTLQYFRQHYDIIKMYMSWIKPYLRNIKRLQLEERFMDSMELVGAFEGSMMEVEFLAKKNLPQYGRWYAVGIINLLYRTRPAMSFQQEGFQRGPKHTGKVTITMRAYVMTKEQIDAYLAMRKKEDIDMLTTIDSSLKEAMDALGTEMKKYLVEAGEKLFKDDVEKKEDKKKNVAVSAAEPFFAVFKGFGEIFGAFTGGVSLFKGKKGFDPIKDDKQKKAAIGDAKNAVWRAFKNYRKAHKIVTY